jgi:phosphatidylglycerol---prolipoprotein diacylglyceryl transferase
MYPTLSYLLDDLFGLNIALPIQTFGLFMGLSFLLAAYVLMLELRRNERLGLIQPTTISYTRGEPMTAGELIFSSVIGFFIGFKLVEAIFNYGALVDNPQEFLLSGRGNLAGGIAGAILSGFLKYREKSKEKLDEPVTVSQQTYPHQLIANITFAAAIGGIVGAKIFHNLENIDDFIADPWGALFSFSGLTYYGGLIVAAVLVIGYGIKIKVKPLLLCDAAAPALLLSYGTGRLGCHLSGDGDWGIVNALQKPTWMNFLPDWTWAYSYPHNVLNEGTRIENCVGKHCFELIPPVFPTPLYEFVACSLLFLVLWKIRKSISVPGILFCVYLILNGIERFFIEQIRVNTKYHIMGHAITQAEIISVCLVLVGIMGIFVLRKRNEMERK